MVSPDVNPGKTLSCRSMIIKQKTEEALQSKPTHHYGSESVTWQQI
jgi:hypothetical protein